MNKKRQQITNRRFYFRRYLFPDLCRCRIHHRWCGSNDTHYLSLMPLIVALFTGTVFMLYVAKIPKRGAITILGIIAGILLFITGMFWMMSAFFVVFGIIADVICASGSFKSFKEKYDSLLPVCTIANGRICANGNHAGPIRCVYEQERRCILFCGRDRFHRRQLVGHSADASGDGSLRSDWRLHWEETAEKSILKRRGSFEMKLDPVLNC